MDNIFYKIIFVGVILASLSGRRLGTFASEGYSSENTKSRSIRDVGAATWPMFEEEELETVPRTTRDMDMKTATVMIDDFWRNFGKSADEIVIKIESDSKATENEEIVDTATNDNSNAQQELAENNLPNSEANEDKAVDENNIQDKSDTASFRFSVRDDTSGQYDGSSSVSPQQFPYQPTTTHYPVEPSYPNANYHANSNHLPVSPSYTGQVPTTQAAPAPQDHYYPYKPSYSRTPPTYPNSIPYQQGLPMSSIPPPPHILQQLLINAHSQNPAILPQLPPYSNSYSGYPNPSKPSVPQPAYSFMPTPTNPTDVRTYPAPYQSPITYPNIVANNGPPPPYFPSYPYSPPTYPQ